MTCLSVCLCVCSPTDSQDRATFTSSPCLLCQVKSREPFLTLTQPFSFSSSSLSCASTSFYVQKADEHIFLISSGFFAAVGAKEGARELFDDPSYVNVDKPRLPVAANGNAHRDAFDMSTYPCTLFGLFKFSTLHSPVILQM